MCVKSLKIISYWRKKEYMCTAQRRTRTGPLLWAKEGSGQRYWPARREIGKQWSSALRTLISAPHILCSSNPVRTVNKQKPVSSLNISNYLAHPSRDDTFLYTALNSFQYEIKRVYSIKKMNVIEKKNNIRDK